MSVYTQLSKQEISDFLTLYDQGTLVSYKGIEAGVENTNYFVNTCKDGEDRHFVLTIFEYQPVELLSFFLDFMELLANAGLPVPGPVHGRDDKPLRTLKGKPCMLQPRLSGAHLDNADLTPEHCAEIGKNLARVHKEGLGADFQQENLRGLRWIDEQVQRMSTLLSKDEAELQSRQWQEIQQGLKAAGDLPAGLIHADLFVDNVLFDQGHISGMIDFFQSCHDWLLYDVAVTVNDWCLNKETLALDPKRTSALLEAYHAVRPFTAAERKAWPVMHRLACLRFWISRLVTYTFPEEGSDHLSDEGAVRHFKDPVEFRDMLELRTQQAHSLILP